MSYTIHDHRHRFAAWAAGSAASVKGCRFRVEQAAGILQAVGLDQIGEAPSNLPDPDDFDLQHRSWRNSMIHVAQKNYELAFRHGIAAKLINVYFKSIFVCGGVHGDPRVKAIHPPVDSLLLDALYLNDIGGQKRNWQTARRRRWSNLSSEQYEALIETIRRVLPPPHGLWEIEQHWPGFRGM